MGFDERGKVRLSMKVVDQQTGQEIKKRRRRRLIRPTSATTRRAPRRPFLFVYEAAATLRDPRELRPVLLALHCRSCSSGIGAAK